MNPRSARSPIVSSARLTRFGLVVAIGLVIAFVIVVVTADGIATVASGRLGGDWAAFRTAGVLARTDPSLLLDAAAQRAAMAEFLEGNFAPFPYPPLFGFLFVPFAFLSFASGYVVYVILLAVAGVVAVHWTMDLAGTSAEWRPVGMLGAMTYAGTFASYGGAQNATITLVVLAGTARLLDRGRSVAAGVVLTALWFKPQYAVPVIGLALVAGHVRTVVVAVAGGFVLWAAHVPVFGVDWTARWAREILHVTDAGNRVFNTTLTVSPVEWIRGVVPAPWGDAVGLGLAAVLGLGFAWLAHRPRDPAAWLALTGVALLLTAPHALRYELTLLVPALAIVARRRGPLPVLVAWVLGPVLLLDLGPALRIAYVVVVAAALVDGLRLVDGDRGPITVGSAAPRPADPPGG